MRRNYATLLQYFTLCMVILPYPFLMNTSHNKNRIVEHGWKNIFKNLLGKTSQNNVSGSHVSPDNEEMKKVMNESSKSKDLKVKQEIFSISLPAIIEDPKTNGDIHKEQSFGSEPCCSHTLMQKENNEKELILNTLVSNMIHHITDEETYLKYLKDLLTYKYMKNDENINSEFECTFLPNTVPSATMNSRPINIKGKSTMKKHGKVRIKSQLQDAPNTNGMHRLQNQQYLHGDKTERIAIRNHILTQMNAICNNDEMYQSLIEQLIDKEESFVQ